LGRWDNRDALGEDTDDDDDDESLEDVIINLKYCSRCKLGVQVDEDTENIWNYCYICGKHLEWHDKEKEFPAD